MKSAVAKLTTGDRIRQLREAAGFNQQAFAHQVHLSVGQLSRIETGRVKHPHTETLERIADELDVSVDLLMGRVS